MKKILFFGKFNWHGEVHEIWKHATNIQRVEFLMIKAVSTKLNIAEYRVRQYFNSNRDNYKIKKSAPGYAFIRHIY